MPDEAEITDAEWGTVKEELEEYIFSEYNLLFTVFIEEVVIREPEQHTKTLFLIGGRMGFAPGEWQPLGMGYGAYPAGCIRMASMGDNGDSCFIILKYYDSIRQRD